MTFNSFELQLIAAQRMFREHPELLMPTLLFALFWSSYLYRQYSLVNYALSLIWMLR